MELNNFLNPEILSTLQTGGYFLMFGLMVAEWPFVTLASAFLASLGFFDIFLVAILWWLGDTIGDIILFYMGRFGFKFLPKNENPKIDEKKIFQKIDQLINENLFLAIIIIKFIPYLPPIGLPYIGRTGISSQKFLFYTFLASIPTPLLAVIFGFNISFFKKLLENSSTLEIIIFSIIFIIFLIWIYFLIKFFKKKIFTKFENIKNNP